VAGGGAARDSCVALGCGKVREAAEVVSGKWRQLDHSVMYLQIHSRASGPRIP